MHEKRLARIKAARAQAGLWQTVRDALDDAIYIIEHPNQTQPPPSERVDIDVLKAKIASLNGTIIALRTELRRFKGELPPRKGTPRPKKAAIA
jgi:hypothetical protein